MSALILRSDTFTVTSATNINAATPRDNLTKDKLGLDTVFTGAPVIVIDRGVTTSFDTIAFVQSTIEPTATIKIETSAASNFTSPTTTGPMTVPLGTINPERAKCHVHNLTATTHRYIRLTFAATSGFYLGRILVGTSIKPSSVSMKVVRTSDDMSDETQFRAYTAYDESANLLGWKVSLPWMSETYFRYTWQPFMQRVGKTKPFLFLPILEDVNTHQSDWCYGTIRAQAEAEHVGTDLWEYRLTMRGIYP